MALNSSKSSQIDHRRQVVASLRLRGMTMREIQEELPNRGIINEKKQAPYTLPIIHSDIKALEAEWQANALRDISELKGNQLAEIREARKKAWESNDLNMVSRFLKQETDLLGTESPRRQEVTGADGGPIQTQESISLEERAARIMQILQIASQRASEQETPNNAGGA